MTHTPTPKDECLATYLNKVSLPFTRKIVYQLNKLKHENIEEIGQLKLKIMEHMADMEKRLQEAIEQFYKNGGGDDGE